MRDAYLSLGGICGAKDGTGLYKQIDRALKAGSRIRKVVLHLDNDEPGRAAAQNIAAMLEGSYEVIDDPPPVGKDVNNYLQSIVYERKTDERKGI